MDPLAFNTLMLGQAAMDEQQRQKQAQSGGLIDTLGKVATGVGLAAAGLYGAKRLGGTVDLSGVDLGKLRRKVSGFVAPKGETPGAPAPSRPAPTSAAERIQNIEEVTRAARAERPQGVRQGSLPSAADVAPEGGEYISPFRSDPKEYISKPVAEARRQEATRQLLSAAETRREPYQASIPGVNPTLMAIRGVAREADEGAGIFYTPGLSKPLSAAPAQLPLPLSSSLTTQQQMKLPGVANQTLGAVNSAEDQITGNLSRSVQRNEDLTPEGVRTLMQARREAAEIRGRKGSAVERSLVFRPEERAAFEQSVAMSTPTPEVTVPTVGTPGAEGMGLLESGAVTGSRPAPIERAASGTAIRGISRVDQGLSTRNPVTKEFEELGGGMGIYGIEPAYASGAVSKQTGEYSAAAMRKPTEVTSAERSYPQGVESPYAKLSDEDLGMMSLMAEPAEAASAQSMLQKRESLDVSREIDRIYKSNPRELAQQKVTDLLRTLKGEG